MAGTTESKPAVHGQKMIEVKVRFWTNGLAGAGEVIPKHARTAGVVRMKRNDLHGIKPGKVVRFRSLMDLPAAIETLLEREGVKLHRSRRMKKYIE